MQDLFHQPTLPAVQASHSTHSSTGARRMRDAQAHASLARQSAFDADQPCARAALRRNARARLPVAEASFGSSPPATPTQPGTQRAALSAIESRRRLAGRRCQRTRCASRKTCSMGKDSALLRLLNSCVATALRGPRLPRAAERISLAIQRVPPTRAPSASGRDAAVGDQRSGGRGHPD